MSKIFSTFFGLLVGLVSTAQETRELAVYRPLFVIDLRNPAGVGFGECPVAGKRSGN